MKKLLKLICAFLVFIIIQAPICSADQEIKSGIELGTLGTRPLVISIAPGYSSITVQIKEIEEACNLLGLTETEVISGKKQIVVVDGEQEIAFQVVKIPGMSFTVLQARWVSETVQTEAEINRLMILVKGQVINPSTGTDGQTTVNQPLFLDIAGHWAEKEINILNQKKIVNGDPQSNFHPDDQITRAEFAAILVRALGIEQTIQIQGRFNDVPADEWYFNVINTAADVGLLNGYTPTTFGPEDPITREQIAVMITRALSYKGKNIESGTTGASILAAFEDSQQISSWAINSVITAVQQEIFNGRSTIQFAPQDNATRAEAAVIVLRMYNK